MAIEKFEDIIAWQKAKEMTIAIYKLHQDSRDVGFRDRFNEPQFL